MYSEDDIARFIYRNKPGGLVIDTNILLLYLIGTYDEGYIESCPLFKENGTNYTRNDFWLLKRIIARFSKVIITPQITAELYSLSKKEFFKDKSFGYIIAVINFLKSSEEQHQKIDSILKVKLPELIKFGFTDLTILELSKDTGVVIITDEKNLYEYSLGQKIPIIKFSHIKNSGFNRVASQSFLKRLSIS